VQKATLDPSDREDLIRSCEGLVRHFAQQFARSGALDLEDAVSEGYVGLVRAANNFDPARGVKFTTFAAVSIRGAIVDFMRKTGPASRGEVRRLTLYDAAWNQLTTENGREPTDQEMACRLAMTGEQLGRLRQSQGLRLVPLNGDAGDFYQDNVAGEDDVEGEVLSRLQASDLKVMVASLMPRDREVIRRRYLLGESLKNIAADLGISESRVSQIEKRALRRLRVMLEQSESLQAA
jgi:RNA polymerase sigma factor (sigma-70 family)